ncbi:MAG: c-type cytochrome [Bacteroidota bacterium]|nr:c-type cytochrome [Bacteroidota bacterium]
MVGFPLKKCTFLTGSAVKLSFLFVIFILFSYNHSLHAQSASEGKQLFTTCAACHTIGGGKMVGPDLKDVTEKRDREWLYSFIRNSQEMVKAGDPIAVEIFNEYNKVPMPPNDFTDEQLESVLLFIEAKSAGEEVTDKAPAGEQTTEAGQADKELALQEQMVIHELERDRNYSPAFWISIALFVLAIFDLVVTRFIKARFVNIFVIIITGIIVGEIIVREAISLGRQEGYAPEQPIWFSHKVHVQQNKIDCRYCHHTVDDSKYAGIPSAQLCMNCHNVVKEGKITGKKEIAKIYDAIENNTPIEWIKVHNLPDHVFFSHAQHANIGQLDCVECHGPVEEMDKVKQVSDLSMGWCLNCHRDSKVTQFETNEFYKHYTELHEKLNSGEISTVSVQDIGGNDCQKCHY